MIIPALNEATTLPTVLSSLQREQPHLDVVVVDDGSTDATAKVAGDAGVPVLSLPYNLGIGGALRTGFRYAVHNDYDAAVQLDADGQHDPSLIEALLEQLDHADFVIGTRFYDGDAGYQVGRTRRGAMRLLELTVRLLTGRRYTDTSSGFRAFNRKVLEFFAFSYPAEYMESVEALVDASYAGFRIVEVPIEMRARAGGNPSTMHAKLAYHYVRLIATLLARVQRRSKVAPAVSPTSSRSTAQEPPVQKPGVQEPASARTAGAPQQSLGAER